VILANIGSICPRKGQHVFIRAIDHFHQHHAAAFAGRCELHYCCRQPARHLHRFARARHRAARAQAADHPHRRDARRPRVLPPLRHLRLHQLRGELARVLLEAMGYELPIISTNVHGIPEMVVDRDEAFLLPPATTCASPTP